MYIILYSHTILYIGTYHKPFAKSAAIDQNLFAHFVGIFLAMQFAILSSSSTIYV